VGRASCSVLDSRLQGSAATLLTTGATIHHVATVLGCSEWVPALALHAVTLPLVEAVESIKVLITSLAVRKDSILSPLSETMIYTG